MIMLTPNPPSNMTSPIMFFPMCTRIIAMWRSMTIKPTLEGGPWRWVGWLLGDTLEATCYFKSRAKCMSWPWVRVCLLLSNYWLIFGSMSFFPIIAPSSTKLVPIFMIQMILALVVGSLVLFPMWLSMLTFVGWFIWKYFVVVFPFPNLP